MSDPAKKDECCSVSLRDRLMSHLVQTVPDGIALCEFGCSKTRCSESEWEHCTRRIDSLKPDDAAGARVADGA